jgi:hypothetical protein
MVAARQLLAQDFSVIIRLGACIVTLENATMKKFGLGFAALLLAAQPFVAGIAMAQAAPAGYAPAAAAAANDADKEICKGEKPTGTRLAKKKVCRTKAEWDEFYRLQRAETEQMQRNDMAIKTPKG